MLQLRNLRIDLQRMHDLRLSFYASLLASREMRCLKEGSNNNKAISQKAQPQHMSHESLPASIRRNHLEQTESLCANNHSVDP